MNLKKVIPVILVLIQSVTLYGQKVSYTYDDNGNRLTRTLDVERLKSGTVQLPVLNPKDLKKSEDMKAAEVEAPVEGELKTVIYPNPTRGSIKVEVSNMPLNSKNEMKLYDLSGTELVSKRNFDSSSELDISKFRDGIYILRIKINDSLFDWKVVKSH